LRLIGGLQEDSAETGSVDLADQAYDARPDHMLMRERWALGLLAVGTAAFFPEALNRFVFPKLAVLAVGVSLAMTVPARGRLPRAATAILTLGSLVLLVCAAAGATPLAQLLGRPPRYEGLLVLPVYLGAGAAAARLLGPGRARGSTAWFLDWLAIAALAIAIEAVLETAGLRPLQSDVARPGSLLGNASDEGAWAVLALGPLASVAFRAREPLHIAGAVGAAVTLVCSASRGALAGGLAAAVLLGLLMPRPRLRLALAAAVVVVVAAVFLVPGTRSRVSGTSPYAAHTANGRVLLWEETLRLLGAHPALGVGPSGYVDAIPAYHDRRYEVQVGPATPPDSPHDWILQAGAAGGLPLILLALALVALTVRRGWESVGRQPTGGEAAAVAGMLAGLVGYGVALLFFFTSPGTAPLAAILGGVLLGAPVDGPARALAVTRSRWGARIVAGSVFAALAMVLAGAALAELPLRSAIVAAASGRLAAADQDFRLARTLRPWDSGVDAAAGHAFATLASDGVAGAGAMGVPWAARALTATPDSTEVLADTAEIDLATARTAEAARLLAVALRLDPSNPDLQVQAAGVALARHEPEAAVELLRSASSFEPGSPAPWQGLERAYTAEHRLRAAALAAARARLLAGTHRRG
jgi:O-antigen ligase